MPTTLISVIAGIIMLGLIIAFHEFGHFLIAKQNGIGVVEFSVGMGPRIISKVYHDTRYSLKLVPFGGACQMLGDDKGVYDPNDTVTNDVSEKSFLSKNVWVRIAVIFAGPFFNFILAFLFSVIIIGAVGIDLPVIDSTIEGLPAAEIDLVAGDRITKMNNSTIRTARDISIFMDDYLYDTAKTLTAEPITITYEREGVTKSATLQPAYSQEYGKFMMGIRWNAARTKVGIGQTIGYSFNEVIYWIRLTFKSLGMLFSGRASVDDLKGPVGIVEIVDDTVKEVSPYGAGSVFLELMNLCVLLSANVGVMNLLPLPALDGGRLVFLIIEAVRGKPIDREKEGYVHMAGILLLLGLMVFVLFKDITHLFK